eukprot:11045939-Alexandrium_andersonii.AAC.1
MPGHPGGPGNVPGGILEDPGHTSRGRARGDIVDGRSVPAHPVNLLEIPVGLQKQRGNPKERRTDRSEQHHGALGQAPGVVVLGCRTPEGPQVRAQRWHQAGDETELAQERPG